MIEKIKKIKYLRMKPEERYVYDIFTNLVEYYNPDQPNDKYYKYNDVLLFYYDGDFWCDYDKFWLILKLDFGLEYQQIQSLVKRMVIEHLIYKDIITQLSVHSKYRTVVEHLIYTNTDLVISYNGVEEHTNCPEITTKFEQHLIRKDKINHESKF